MVKLVLKLAILGLIANALYQVVPPFYTNWKFRDALKELAGFFPQSGLYLTVVPTYIGGFMALSWAGNGRNAPRGSVQGPTDFGTRGYGGPCPPPGDKPHHYHITVFALKVDKLDIPGNGTSAMVGFNLNANKLATARVTGLYAR